MTIAYQLVVFDMDGTLTHDALDFEALRLELRLAERRPILEWIAALPESQRDHATKVLEQHECRAAEICEPRAGTADALKELARRKVRTALLTRNSRQSVERIVTRHRWPLEVLVSRDEPPFKPHPASLQRILQHYGIGPDATLMVGDYIFDIQVARAAGVASVLLLDAAAPRPTFADEADFCIFDIADIVRLLDEPEKFRRKSHVFANDYRQQKYVEKG